jgi:hypothetical protein
MNRSNHLAFQKIILRTLVLIVLGSLGTLSPAYSQNIAFAKKLADDYNKYKSEYIQEKLYVHTDKDSYLTREICWFRIYYMEAFLNAPTNISSIAYVELLDRKNQPVVQQKVSLKPGESFGSFVIPTDLASGTYSFRAYTNWMKNFGAEYFFQKAIRIVNPKNVLTDTTVAKQKKYDVQFFPEGGNLVQDIESKLGFRVTNAYGEGLEFEGMLLNQYGDTVLKFHPLHLGMGSFVFKPVKGQSYKAIIRFPKGETVTKDLPTPYSNGYVINLSKKNDAKIVLSVHTSTDIDEQDIYLVVHGQRTILPIKTGKLTGNNFSFIVEPSELEDGISQFTLFNSTGQPVCERLFFKYPEKKLVINAEIDTEYSTRKKVNLDLSAGDQSGKSTIADLSMAVYRIDSLQGIDEMNIRNYLYLTANLGQFESPAFYFQNEGKSRDEDMENLMLTHGWRRFNWRDILQHKPLPIEFTPEFNGHIINGKLVSGKTGAAVPSESVYLSVPSKRMQFRPSFSDSAGLIKFEIVQFYGSQDIIVQTNPKEDSLSHIEITSPFYQKYADNLLPDFSIPSKNSPTLLDQSIHEQVQRVYTGLQLNQFEIQIVDSSPLYITPDEKYFLDDYTRFQTMEEVLREYVHSMKVNRQRDNFQLYLIDNPNQRFFSDEPLILIDGVPYFNSNELIQQDPLKIQRLDLINKQYLVGYQTYAGIINLTTYRGDLEGVWLDPHALVLDYPGIPAEREFFQPQYETENQIGSRMPDYRTLLDWVPQIKSGVGGKAQLSFYTSDLPGKYVVSVQGISNTGEPGSKLIFFNVKK